MKTIDECADELKISKNTLLRHKKAGAFKHIALRKDAMLYDINEICAYFGLSYENNPPSSTNSILYTSHRLSPPITEDEYNSRIAESQKIINRITKKRIINKDTLLKGVCKHIGIINYSNSSRNAKCVIARNITAVILRKELKLSLEEIGELIGKGHCNVINILKNMDMDFVKSNRICYRYMLMIFGIYGIKNNFKYIKGEYKNYNGKYIVKDIRSSKEEEFKTIKEIAINFSRDEGTVRRAANNENRIFCGYYTIEKA